MSDLLFRVFCQECRDRYGASQPAYQGESREAAEQTLRAIAPIPGHSPRLQVASLRWDDVDRVVM